MITVRDRDERGQSQTGWLDGRHTFSFAGYMDPKHMGFRSLRVINDDRVIPGAGFPTHGHRDMEIISYVVDGALEHKDSMGNGSVIRPGDVQRMTAGTGISHSEFNPSDKEGGRFLQIWIIPEEKNLEPGYEQKSFTEEERLNQLRLVVDREGKDGAVKVHQDVRLYTATLTDGHVVTHLVEDGRSVWVQVVRGQIEVNGEPLREGDGAAITDEAEVTVSATTDAEVLLFDLA